MSNGDSFPIKDDAAKLREKITRKILHHMSMIRACMIMQKEGNVRCETHARDSIILEANVKRQNIA
jgi:hypothetical protein